MERQAPTRSLSEVIVERFTEKTPLPAALRPTFERMFEPAAIDEVFEKHWETQ